MKTFSEIFKSAFQRVAQIGAARKSAFIRAKGETPDLQTSAKYSREVWEFPALPSETADDRADIAFVRAVQKVEKLAAGRLQNPHFRLTDLGKGKGKGKVSGANRNGSSAPAPALTA